MRSGGAVRALAAALCLALIGGVVACGESEETDVVEGEPLELGDLRLTVQLTRFLNPSDREDRAYLADQEDPPPGESYLAVFVEVENEGDDPASLPSADQVSVVDTTGQSFEPLPSDSVFALPLGAEVPGGGEVPAPDTPAASGPVQGSFVLFLVDESVTENRPLELELESDGETGTVELDI